MSSIDSSLRVDSVLFRDDGSGISATVSFQVSAVVNANAESAI